MYLFYIVKFLLSLSFRPISLLRLKRHIINILYLMRTSYLIIYSILIIYLHVRSTRWHLRSPTLAEVLSGIWIFKPICVIVIDFAQKVKFLIVIVLRLNFADFWRSYCFRTVYHCYWLCLNISTSSIRQLFKVYKNLHLDIMLHITIIFVITAPQSLWVLRLWRLCINFHRFYWIIKVHFPWLLLVSVGYQIVGVLIVFVV